MCRYCDAVLIGFSHPKASFFSLRGQRKETKRKARPDAAYFLRSVIFIVGLPEGISYPSGNVRPPCRTPFRAIPDKNASARRGITGMGRLS